MRQKLRRPKKKKEAKIKQTIRRQKLIRRQKSKRKNRKSKKSMVQTDRSKKTGPKRRVEIDELKKQV